MLCYVTLTALYTNMCYVMTCYVDAVYCFNCVSGYVSFETNIQNNEIQDIQPRTRPRINISQVPAGK